MRVTSMKHYVTLYVLHLKTLNVVRLVTALFEATGMFFYIAVNFGTVRFYSIIPMPWYLLFPSSIAMTSLMLSYGLWYIINVYEISREVKQGWELSLENKPLRKWFQRKVKSVQCFKVFTGIGDHNFFFNKRSTRNTFLWYAVEKTIAAIMFKSRQTK